MSLASVKSKCCVIWIVLLTAACLFTEARATTPAGIQGYPEIAEYYSGKMPDLGPAVALDEKHDVVMALGKPTLFLCTRDGHIMHVEPMEAVGHAWREYRPAMAVCGPGHIVIVHNTSDMYGGPPTKYEYHIDPKTFAFSQVPEIRAASFEKAVVFQGAIYTILWDALISVDLASGVVSVLNRLVDNPWSALYADEKGPVLAEQNNRCRWRSGAWELLDSPDPDSALFGLTAVDTPIADIQLLLPAFRDDRSHVLELAEIVNGRIEQVHLPPPTARDFMLNCDQQRYDSSNLENKTGPCQLINGKLIFALCGGPDEEFSSMGGLGEYDPATGEVKVEYIPHFIDLCVADMLIEGSTYYLALHHHGESHLPAGFAIYERDTDTYIYTPLMFELASVYRAGDEIILLAAEGFYRYRDGKLRHFTIVHEKDGALVLRELPIRLGYERVYVLRNNYGE